MTSVMEWMESRGVEDVDVYDCEVQIGRAWGLPYDGVEGMETVQGWILNEVNVVDLDCGDVVADVWGFVIRNLGILQRYASEWTSLKVDASEEGLANGVVIVMALMSGEAAADSYGPLARTLRGIA